MCYFWQRAIRSNASLKLQSEMQKSLAVIFFTNSSWVLLMYVRRKKAPVEKTSWNKPLGKSFRMLKVANRKTFSPLCAWMARNLFIFSLTCNAFDAHFFQRGPHFLDAGGNCGFFVEAGHDNRNLYLFFGWIPTSISSQPWFDWIRWHKKPPKS